MADRLVEMEEDNHGLPFYCNNKWSKFQEIYPPNFWKKVIAEATASYLLIFVTCGASALGEDGKISKLGASVASGLIVTVMIYAVGHISGAHMNPAVTFAFAAVRHFPWKYVPFYSTAQIVGATCASLTLSALMRPLGNIGTTSPLGSELQALVVEIITTFNMMFVTSAVATDTKAVGELAGIAVGSAVCITSILAGPISGGSMNPARTLGPAIASNYYEGVWVYVLGPVCGTLMGSWAYRLIRLSEKPVHALTRASGSLKLRRSNGNLQQTNILPNPSHEAV